MVTHCVGKRFLTGSLGAGGCKLIFLYNHVHMGHKIRGKESERACTFCSLHSTFPWSYVSRSYVPWVLSSLGPMFLGSYFSSLLSYVPWVLYSLGPILSVSYFPWVLSSLGSMFLGSYVLWVPCFLSSMFLGSYIPWVHVPLHPMFPGSYVR